MSQIAQMSPEEIAERFHVTGRSEIAQILNDLINHRENVSVYFDGGRASFLTRLLAVWPRYHWLLLDWSGSNELNTAFMRSEDSVLVASQSGVKVQFPVGKASLTAYGDDGEMAFAVPLPSRIVRLQRRDYYRIALPLATPLMVRWEMVAGSAMLVPAHDLSVAGIGLRLDGAPETLSPGDSAGRVRFSLPDETEVQAELICRHLTPLELRGGQRSHVLGAAFRALSPANERHIQRYIIHVEHERHQLAAP